MSRYRVVRSPTRDLENVMFEAYEVPCNPDDYLGRSGDLFADGQWGLTGTDAAARQRLRPDRSIQSVFSERCARAQAAICAAYPEAKGEPGKERPDGVRRWLSPSGEKIKRLRRLRAELRQLEDEIHAENSGWVEIELADEPAVPTEPR